MSGFKAGLARLVSGFAICASAPAAHANVSISSKPTQNMSCSAGVCTATAKKAVLNVSNLQSMLANGDVTVKTGSLATDITVEQALTWASTKRLTLDAQQSVIVNRPVSITGKGALTITVNDGGSGGDYAFRGKGHVEFWDVASNLIIGGQSFKLVGNIAALAKGVNKNASGNFALANNYDATVDGTYNRAPITKDFRGTFEGLGNRISGLSIENGADHSSVALFAVLVSPGLIRDVGLSDVKITSTGYTSTAAGLVAQSLGSIANSFVTGSIRAGDGDGMAGNAGGLVGYSTVSIVNSYAAVSIDAGSGQIAGGLAGEIDGAAYDSYATGPVKAGALSYAGGFAGINHSSSAIVRCHATGNVSGGKEPIVGSFLSSNFGTISQSYALGSVTKAGRGGVEGGFSAFNADGATISQSYSRGDSHGSGGDKSFDEANGGFAGYNLGTITQSYSTGAPSTGDKAKSFVGGLLGADDAAPGSLANTYWDLDTSGISDPSQGAGAPPNDPGVTGLTSSQFKSGLPDGFDPDIWGRDPNINNGYPYLLANPPQ